MFKRRFNNQDGRISDPTAAAQMVGVGDGWPGLEPPAARRRCDTGRRARGRGKMSALLD